MTHINNWVNAESVEITELGRIYAEKVSDFLDAVDAYNEQRRADTEVRLERAAIAAAKAYADRVRERGW